METPEISNTMTEKNVNGVLELNSVINGNDSSNEKTSVDSRTSSEIKELVEETMASIAQESENNGPCHSNKPVEESKIEAENSCSAISKIDEEKDSDENLNTSEAVSNKSTENSKDNDATKLTITNIAIVNQENNIPPSKANGELTSEPKAVINAGVATQKYRDGSGSDDDSSSTFSVGSSSECSDSFFDKMHKNCTTNKIVNIKTKGELDMDDLPPIEDLTIAVTESEMQKIGTIYAIVDKLVIVRALKDLQPLDLDSVLFLTNEKPLGRIFDVFGPIVEPFYSVRFNSPQHIADRCIVNDADVFFAPEKTEITKFVFVDQLRKQKGSDASWQDNNEPPEEHLDYSDDEEEKAAIRKRRAKNRARSAEEDDVQILPNKINNRAKDPLSPWMMKESPSQNYNTPQRYRGNKSAPHNPFFTPYSQTPPSQGSSYPGLARPNMAAVMTSKYTPPASKTNSLHVSTNPPQQNFGPAPPTFRFRPSVIFQQQPPTPQPFLFQARPAQYLPNQMAPQSPVPSFASRPQQFVVQPSVSPAPIMSPFQGAPIFGQLVMSPPPVQNQFMGQQQVLSYSYPTYRPATFGNPAPNYSQTATLAVNSANHNKNLVSQASQFVSQAPSYVTQAPNYASQAPNYASQAPNYASQAPNFTSQASSYASQAPNFVNPTPLFVSQAGGFVNPNVPMLVQTPMGPQFQQVQSVGPPPAMRIAPLSVNIPSQSPNAIHPFLQQSPGLLNVMPPPRQQDFSHNRY